MATKPELTYDIGYNGVVALALNKDSDVLTPIMTTDGSVSISHPQIFTTGIWGAGWFNGSKNVCFATDYPTLQAQVGFQLTHGSGTDVFKTLGRFASTQRCIPKNMKILPNGIAGYYGKSYCQSISFQTSQDSIVTGSFSSKSPAFEASFSNDKATSSTNSNSQIHKIAQKYNDVYPYYGTSIEIGGKNVKDLISWSISQSTQILFQKVCNGKDDIKDITADYVAFGLLQANGSFSQICLKNLKDSTEFRKLGITQYNKNVITMNNVNGGAKHKIQMYGISFNSQTQNVSTGNQLLQCSYDFVVIGDGNTEKPLLDFD